MAESEGIIIAIDGYSSCGKSTLAKDLAQALQYRHIDTGAMYRAVTLYFLQNEVDTNDGEAVRLALQDIQIEFRIDEASGKMHTYLNGQDVEKDIRNPTVTKNVSPVATLSQVRRKLVEQQRLMSRSKGIIMDGRDIGTVVFPDADLKLFLIADIDIRTARRLDEMVAKGYSVAFEDVKSNLLERDRIDTSRTDSPLKKADDAIVIDTSNQTRESQLALSLALVQQTIDQQKQVT